MIDWLAEHKETIMMAIEIVLMATILYAITRFFRGTRGAGILRGYVILLIATYALAFLLARIFELDVIRWVIETSLPFAFIALIVVLQPEIRQAMIKLGLTPMQALSRAEEAFFDVLARSVEELSRQRIGALIAVEGRIGLKEVVESGVAIDAVVSPRILRAIFFPGSPLHDGGVVIRNQRVAAAACLFPLTDKLKVHGKHGTRHLAAVGVTQESDALVIVVSEETGEISLAQRGELTGSIRPESLQSKLQERYLQ